MIYKQLKTQYTLSTPSPYSLPAFLYPCHLFPKSNSYQYACMYVHKPQQVVWPYTNRFIGLQHDPWPLTYPSALLHGMIVAVEGVYTVVLIRQKAIMMTGRPELNDNLDSTNQKVGGCVDVALTSEESAH